ncbi:laminin subunit beta-3-like [Pocillopora verrucosa]|uniref:laminin subunit beta-3-like n=1 Tax=Pocillopora verrucosa TaxID=203993 RepID=UPI00334010C6
MTFQAEDATPITTYGNCSCKPKLIGKKCDVCSPGFFDAKQGCLACNCSTVGSKIPDQFDRNSGQCSCKPNVIGRTCDQCRPDYFNFASGQGCQDCACFFTWCQHFSAQCPM